MKPELDLVSEAIKSPFVAVVLLIAFSLSACASGSALVTGQTRTEIVDYASIRILTQMPVGAEEIAIVKASSDAGMTQQGSLDDLRPDFPPA